MLRVLESLTLIGINEGKNGIARKCEVTLERSSLFTRTSYVSVCVCACVCVCVSVCVCVCV